MKTCLRLALDNGEPGRLLDLSLVGDDHEFGPSPDGTEIHIEGHGEFTVTRGTPHQDAPPEPPAVNGVPFSEVLVNDDGTIARRIQLRRRDPAEARTRLRAMAMSEDIIEEILKR